MIYFLDNSLQLQKIVTSKNVISAIHEHELNGLIRADVELDLSYANKFLVLGIDHVGYYYKDDFYLHKIQRVEYDHVNETATVVLRHIFFEDMIFGKLIRDVRPQNQDALTVSRQTIDANTRWQTIMTDVTGRLSTNFYWQVPYEVIEFMTENYRIDYLPKILFDGQKVNGFQLHLANKIGEDKNIRIPYGSRVLDLKYEEDYSEIITKLVVHGKGEEVGDGYGRRIDISGVNFNRNGVKSPVGSIYLEDESITNTYGNDGQTPREGREVFEDIESPNELAEAGYQHYLQVSRPQMLFTADVADIGDVGIGDSVMIIRREYDVYFNARIHKLSVDLLYPEDAQVELGDYEHFKESKIARKTREKNNRVQGQLSDRITRLKREANERFDNEVAQWKSEYEQALIDVQAEIEADRENMTNLIEGTRTDFTDNLNAEIAQSKEYAEQQAQEKADSVQSNLDSFSERHQQLYDEVTGNVLDIDTFLGDKSKTLEQQFDKVRADFGTLQTELDGVESDLTATKTDLQNQLDEARAELEGLEVGGRNYIKDSKVIPMTAADSGARDNTDHIVTDDYIEIKANKDFQSYWYRYYILTTDNRISDESIFVYDSDYQTLGIDVLTESDNFEMYINQRQRDHTNSYSSDSISIPNTNGKWQRVFISLPLKHDGLERSVFYVFVNGGRRADNTKAFLANDYIRFKNSKLEKGNRGTDWTPAPEDTEEKITTLNQQIEFINGQLSAKLEQTDIEPINNKITEYGNTLTANAQSIQSLLDKTELHDGDITQWSNETKANAESISQTLTRVEETEAGISQAQTDIQTNADGIAGVIRDVETIDGNLSTLTTEFNVEAGKIETLISKTDGHDTRLTDIVADIDGIETTVAANDAWLGTYGSAAEQTIAGFEQKVWQSDIINPNLIPLSDVSNQHNGGGALHQWFGWGTSTIASYSDYMLVANTNTSSSMGIRTPIMGDYLISGRTYTLSWQIGHLHVQDGLMSKEFNYCYVNGIDSGSVKLPVPQRVLIESTSQQDLYQYKLTFVMPEGITPTTRILIGDTVTPGNNVVYRFRYPKLELGNFFTAYHSSFSMLEQRTDKLALTVQDLASISGEDIITQSDIQVKSDEIILGSMILGPEDFASIISISPTAIDMITDNLNLTGNLNVSGQITTLAVNAVEGNFARLFANQLTTDVIKSSHIEASTSLIRKLFVNSARIDELITQTHFVNEMHALTLNVVELNASHIRSRLLTANTIEAEWIKSGTALLDRVFSSTAMFERMMAKSGFVTTLNTVTIDTDQLTIRRPDGVAWVSNGMARFDIPVQVQEYMDTSVEWTGQRYVTHARGAQKCAILYTSHAGRYLRIGLTTGMRYDAQHASTHMGVVIRPENSPSGTNWQPMIEEKIVYKSSNDYQIYEIDLGKPTFAAASFSLEFYRIGDNVVNPVTLRIHRAWITG